MKTKFWLGNFRLTSEATVHAFNLVKMQSYIINQLLLSIQVINVAFHTQRGDWWIVWVDTEDTMALSPSMSSCIVEPLSSYCQCCTQPSQTGTSPYLWLCLCVSVRQTGPEKDTTQTELSILSSSYPVACPKHLRVWVKTEFNALAKVEGSTQEFWIATEANLGETCLCHL